MCLDLNIISSFFFFKILTHYLIQAALELLILLGPSPKCWQLALQMCTTVFGTNKMKYFNIFKSYIYLNIVCTFSSVLHGALGRPESSCASVLPSAV